MSSVNLMHRVLVMASLLRAAALTFAVLGPAAARADMPPIAPAFLARDLLAVGHVGTQRPPPGSGTGQGGCSGTLIAPTLVLTAAHCAAARRDAPQELFVTFGWRRDGPPLWRGTAAQIVVDTGYLPGRYEIETLHHDLALVVLPRPVPGDLVAPIPLEAGFMADLYASYGYLAESDTLLRGNDECNAVHLTEALVGFDCDVVSGFSGGPLLAMTPDGPVLSAVVVANAPGVRTGIRSFAAIPPPDLFPGGTYPE